MKKHIITKIKNEMKNDLNDVQMKKLLKTLENCLRDFYPEADSTDQQDYVKIFLSAKRVEGCSDKTVRYYDSTIRNVISAIKKDITDITTYDLRIYLLLRLPIIALGCIDRKHYPIIKELYGDSGGI